MKLEQAVKMIQDQLALVDHTGETKTQQLIWELGFLMGMLADELRKEIKTWLNTSVGQVIH